MYLHLQKMLVTILQIRLLQPNTHLKQLMGLNAISFTPSGVQCMAFLVNFVMRWGIATAVTTAAAARSRATKLFTPVILEYKND